MSAKVQITGPARSLLRVREKPGTLKDVRGNFGHGGPATAVVVTFQLVETNRRLAIEIDEAAWAELRERVDRAFVFEHEPRRKARG